MFLGKGTLKICSKFTGDHPCRSAISIMLQSNFIEIAFRHGCCPVNLLHIFRTPFVKNTSVWLLLKISKSIGILYKSRDVLSKQCLKQLYFSFIHSYVNYANIAWTSTSKSKLERLYCCQKHAACVIYPKDRFTRKSWIK